MADIFTALKPHFYLGQHDVCLNLAFAHLKSFPDDVRVWEFVGVIYSEQGQWLKAARAFEEASLIAPISDYSRVCLADVYGELGRHELTRSLLNRVASREDIDWRILRRVASGLDKYGFSRDALQQARRIIERLPDEGQAYYDAAYYAIRSGELFCTAVGLARKAVMLSPNNILFRVGLATILFSHGQPKDAYEPVRRFEQADYEIIECTCCLERLKSIMEAAGDLRQVQTITRRLQGLTSTGGHSHA